MTTPLKSPWKRPFDLDTVWAVLPFGLIGMGFSLMPLKSWDYWWHLAYGRVIDRTHEMPLFADFLYTMPADAPSYVQAWLSQWALYRIHEIIGLAGVLILRDFLAIGAFALLGYWSARRSGSWAIGAILTLLAAPFGFLCIAARTHLLAWPWFLPLMAVAYGVRTGRLSRYWLASIPALSVLWSNIHGTFMIPTLVCLAFLGASIGDRLVRPTEFSKTKVGSWAATTLFSVLGILLNPRGFEIFLYLQDLTTNQENRTYITEWFPATPFYPPFYGALFWVLLVGLIALMAKEWRKVDLADLFLFAGFSLLAIGQSRALLWVGLCFPVVAAPYAAQFRVIFGQGGPTSKAMQAVNALIAAGLIIGVVGMQPWSGENVRAAETQISPTRRSSPLLGLVMDDTPVEAVQWLKAHKQEWRVFHDHRYPGYILYELQDAFPKQMVYVDNRVELPSAKDWRTFDAVSNGQGWSETFARYDVNAVVAAMKTQSKLVKALEGSSEWSQKFRNEHYVLFVRE
jgi:hypothetical protein